MSGWVRSPPTDESIQTQQTNSIKIRIANKSNVEMKNIVITYYSDDEDYSQRVKTMVDLAPGRKRQITVQLAHRIATRLWKR